jgi:hypothetical protein
MTVRKAWIGMNAPWLRIPIFLVPLFETIGVSLFFDFYPIKSMFDD